MCEYSGCARDRGAEHPLRAGARRRRGHAGGARGQHHGRARGQRRRQDLAAADDLRTAAGQRRERTPRRSGHSRGGGRGSRQARTRPGPRGTGRDHRADDRGEPAPGRAVARWGRSGPRGDVRVVPAPARAPHAVRRLAVGRRASDALDRPRADGQAARAAARRALPGARADRQRADHEAHSRARLRARPGGPAGRAERAQRTVDRRPRPRAQPRRPTRTSAMPTWGSER
jgi:hypothetical protein